MRRSRLRDAGWRKAVAAPPASRRTSAGRTPTTHPRRTPTPEADLSGGFVHWRKVPFESGFRPPAGAAIFLRSSSIRSPLAFSPRSSSRFAEQRPRACRFSRTCRRSPRAFAQQGSCPRAKDRLTHGVRPAGMGAENSLLPEARKREIAGNRPQTDDRVQDAQSRPWDPPRLVYLRPLMTPEPLEHVVDWTLQARRRVLRLFLTSAPLSLPGSPGAGRRRRRPVMVDAAIVLAADVSRASTTRSSRFSGAATRTRFKAPNSSMRSPPGRMARSRSPMSNGPATARRSSWSTGR